MKKKRTLRTTSMAPVCEDDWRVRDDLSTLERAQEIQCDPKRIKSVQDHIRDKRAQHARLLRLKGKAI